MDIKINTYFSGGGLFDIGVSEETGDVQQTFEIDPVCCATQRRNFNGVQVNESDIRHKLALEEMPAHVKLFAWPCTRYSTAADIHGTRTGDELFLHAFRHTVLNPPDVFVAENVPGMKKFKVVM